MFCPSAPRIWLLWHIQLLCCRGAPSWWTLWGGSSFRDSSHPAPESLQECWELRGDGLVVWDSVGSMPRKSGCMSKSATSLVQPPGSSTSPTGSYRATWGGEQAVLHLIGSVWYYLRKCGSNGLAWSGINNSNPMFVWGDPSNGRP